MAENTLTHQSNKSIKPLKCAVKVLAVLLSIVTIIFMVGWTIENHDLINSGLSFGGHFWVATSFTTFFIGVVAWCICVGISVIRADIKDSKRTGYLLSLLAGILILAVTGCYFGYTSLMSTFTDKSTLDIYQSIVLEVFEDALILSIVIPIISFVGWLLCSLPNNYD